MVLLGTPHISAEIERWKTVSSLLGGTSKDRKKTLIAPEDTQRWATDFSQANIDVPILSAYETLETKVSMGSRIRPWKTQVSSTHPVYHIGDSKENLS